MDAKEVIAMEDNISRAKYRNEAANNMDLRSRSRSCSFLRMLNQCRCTLGLCCVHRKECVERRSE